MGLAEFLSEISGTSLTLRTTLVKKCSFTLILFPILLSGCGDSPSSSKPVTGIVDSEEGTLSQTEMVEYERLRKFYVAYYRLVDSSVLNSPEMSDPESHLQLTPASGASKDELEGLKQGVHDTLFMHMNFSPLDVDEADEILAKAKAPLLSELMKDYQSSVDAVIGRGFIQNDTEFYMLKELADDNPRLYRLLEEYEFGDRQ